MTIAPSPPISGDLPRDFNSRDALNALLANEFPEAEGELSAIQGGRRAAEAMLKRVDAKRYARSRNHLNGAVTGLSPYIRHGVFSLAEVRDAVFERIRSREEGQKLINELGWRDFWQRMWQELGDRINEDREEFKTGHPASSYSKDLPDDVREGRTGLACMDSFRDDLVNRGWLHNHARMWMAAWLVHWRKVHWKAGADWFLEHLLDGDPASNQLSWQWVASTFSHKPYFFNRDNLERYSDGRYCKSCANANQCPFDASYDELEQQLFVVQAPIRAGAPQRRNGRSRSSRSSNNSSHNSRSTQKSTQRYQ